MQLSRRSFFAGLGATFAVATTGFIPTVATATVPAVDPSIIEIVQKAIKTAFEQHLFEANDEWTRRSITQSISGYLNEIKNTNKLYDFAAICDYSNNPAELIHQNEVHVDVYVKPTKSIDFLLFNSVVTKQGVDFQVGDGRLYDEDDSIIGGPHYTRLRA